VCIAGSLSKENKKKLKSWALEMIEDNMPLI
jgi:hypothetical protein